MECHESSKYDLVAHLHGELDEAAAMEVKRHLLDCASCRDELRSLEAVLRLVREAHQVEPSPAFAERVAASAGAQREDEGAPAPAVWAGTLTESEEEVEPSGRQRVYVIDWPGTLSWRERLVLRLRLFLGSMPAWGLSTSAHLLVFLILTVIFFAPPAERPPVTARLSLAPAAADDAFEVSPWAHYASAPGEVRAEFCALPEDPWEHMEQDRWLMEMVRLRTNAAERDRLLKANGGDAETARAVRRGLEWLARNQEVGGAYDGSWSPGAHGAVDDAYRVALTGLATLAFAAEGNTPTTGEYKTCVAKAVTFLARQQQHDGLLGPRRGRYMYDHGIATLALLEIFCVTRDMELAPVVERAVNFILQAQTPAGGWGYTLAARTCDAVVTTWQVMALRLGLGLGMKEIAVALRRADAWLLCITNQHGEVGYSAINHFPNGHQTLTAMGLMAGYLMGRGGSDPVTAARIAALLTTIPPDAAFKDPMALDLCHLWFGSLALVRTQESNGSRWEPWNERVKKALVALQQRGENGESARGGRGCAGGNWALIDRWSSFGGSVYTTSLAVLTLQSYYRYPPG